MMLSRTAAALPRQIRRTPAVASFATKRRTRSPQNATQYQDAWARCEGPQHDQGGLHRAFKPKEGSMSDYLKRVSLSPWVPVPDPVARRMLELAKAGSDDIHVELGSGDGRMNFHAIDQPFMVKQSTGIDIDEEINKVAQTRLDKRHPKPNMQFIVEDLTSADAIGWKEVQKATVITMYFVQDGLLKLRPKLEEMMLGRQVRVVCCGYKMPEWQESWVEVMLDLPIYVYEYGSIAEQMPSLTPAERAKMIEEDAAEVRTDQLTLEEEAFVNTNSKYDDVEEIVHNPLGDPDEMLDGHWDDFDQEEEVDPDNPPEISSWRPPE